MRIKYSNMAAFLLLCAFLFSCTGKNDAAGKKSSSTGNPALDSLNTLISADPTNAQLYAGRAAIFLELNNYDNALADLQTAITTDSLQPPYYHLLTDVYIQYFKSWQALRAIQKAADLFPNDIPTLHKLAETQLLLRQYAESLSTLNSLLTLDPNNADAHLLLGMNFKESGDTARAINSFQKAVNLNSELLDGWINLGQLHESRGHAVAGKYYETAVQIAPENVLAHHAKADYLSRSDDLDGALASYRTILEINPEYVEACFNSGLIYLDLDSIPQARQQFDRAVSISPLHVRAYYYRGYCSEQSGDLAQAEADYRKALSFAPDFPLAQQGLSRLNAVK